MKITLMTQIYVNRVSGSLLSKGYETELNKQDHCLQERKCPFEGRCI